MKSEVPPSPAALACKEVGMYLIGNDIIDLSRLGEHPRAGQSRLWRKLLSDDEYEWLSARDEPTLDLWKLWALKEGAYKCYFQFTGHRFYAPKKFVCRELPSNPANPCVNVQVDTPAGIFYANIQQSPYYIQALCAASSTQLERAACRTFLIHHQNARDLSRQLRARTRQWIAKKWDLPENELNWEDSMGHPRLFRRGEALGAGFSLSHHGGWGAVAMLPASSSNIGRL